MGYVFDNNSPIYLQLLNHFRKLIVAEKWSPGSRVPSVRDLALAFGVNPNTIQRALMELERDGLAQSERTSGRFITEDKERITKIRESLADEKLKDCVRELSELGLSLDKSLTLFEKTWTLEERNTHGKQHRN